MTSALPLSAPPIAVGRKKFRRPKGKKKIPMEVPSSSSSAPPWVELPRDVTAYILQRLGAVEILENAQKVCTSWRSVCQDPAMWRVIDMKNPDIFQDKAYDIMCRQAVDRSQGQLIDINIEYFGTDELLQYISERSSYLRRLRLAWCYGISGKGLREAVRNFPQLEELHLFFMSSVHAEDIDTIGISCPMLKSFTFDDRGYKFSLRETNDYALAVAKTMPYLCHLQLVGNTMNNEGLEAILNGCPHLESLDLRRCFSVDLIGELGKRAQQIKDLRCPWDSTADYEWDATIYDDEEYERTIFDYDEYEYDDNYPNLCSRDVESDIEGWFSD